MEASEFADPGLACAPRQGPAAKHQLFLRFLSAVHSHCEETYGAASLAVPSNGGGASAVGVVASAAGFIGAAGGGGGCGVARSSPPHLLSSALNASAEEVVGYLAPAASVRSRYDLAPDEPRRPTIGGRVVSAAVFSAMQASTAASASAAVAGAIGGATAVQANSDAPPICAQCLPFLQSLGPSKELAKARQLVCTHHAQQQQQHQRQQQQPQQLQHRGQDGGAGQVAAGSSGARLVSRPEFIPRKDTPEGFWSGRTDDVPDSDA